MAARAGVPTKRLIALGTSEIRGCIFGLEHAGRPRELFPHSVHGSRQRKAQTHFLCHYLKKGRLVYEKEKETSTERSYLSLKKNFVSRASDNI